MINDTEWYFSQEGINSYAQQDTPEKKTLFLHAYLRKVSPGFLESGVLFKVAFLLADGVASSSLPCATYPNIIDETKNPFICYLIKGKYYSEKVLYHIFLSILHGIVDTADDKAWIYDDELLSDGGYTRILRDSMHDYSDFMPMYPAFKVNKGCEFLQLQIIWMFGEVDRR